MTATTTLHASPAGQAHDHPHDHDHPHHHDHPIPKEPVTDLGVSSVLDIGDTIGALVVFLDDQPPGAELYCCLTGRLDTRFHTGIHPRNVGADIVDVAVFPSVPEGTYDLLDHDLQPCATITLTGGVVTELDLCT